ncbi:unnamed protein product [Dimorphilus gyrociliatus]|uniref:Uncharacterized protein n=1 Tax=Dimorphilus gyrociliatus TaxID=2664684 RepID=A0A7I8W8E0_9ANNE|nr:unnamed protein product [Dimorphilus gyrociliatus]
MSNQLGVSHLCKLFADYCRPSVDSTQGVPSQQILEDKLYKMLPLFCQTFRDSPPNEVMKEFKDAHNFCNHVSRLMVNQIRHRAAKYSTVDASIKIANWLEDERDPRSGALLLRTLLILARVDPSLIDCMSAAMLPSTLVKSLYLFFDLPVARENEEKRRGMLSVFSQLLCQLATQPSCAEELAKKDDMILLFNTATSWWEDSKNSMWRVAASQVMATLSRHALTLNVINHVQKKSCIKVALKNIQTNQRKSRPLNLVEMLITILGFVKDSARLSPLLLEDLRACHGYNVIVDLILACDARRSADEMEESGQAVRTLVMLLASLATCGSVPLRPAQPETLFQIPNFVMPQPSGKGLTVSNAASVAALQTAWGRTTSERVCCCVLDALLTLCRQEHANYFVLEPHGALISQLVEQMASRPPSSQVLLFELLDFVVQELRHVPSKEIVALGIVIKSNVDFRTSLKAIEWLRSLLSHENSPCVATYSDTLRELGILEIAVSILKNHTSKILETIKIDEGEEAIAAACWEFVKDLVIGKNNSNASVFRECGGTKLLADLLSIDDRRKDALNVLKVILQTNPTEEDMNVLMTCLQTAPVTSLKIRTDVLRCVFELLKEKHRVRTVFRKVNGFVYVTSVLVALEGCLSEPTRFQNLQDDDLTDLFYAVFCTITLAMRYEPANARFFATEVRYASLTEAIRLLGCFSSEVDTQPIKLSDSHNIKDTQIFTNLFKSLDHTSVAENLPSRIIWATHLLRYLYDVAFDVFEKSSTDERIVHAGAIVSMLHLVPAIDNVALQFTACELIRTSVNSDRNQQIMCEAGLSHELLTHCASALEDEQHPLHLPLQSIFERLSAHALSPRDLRLFLRLGSPLCCSPDIDVDLDAKTVPITRVKCLVSMTTPRGSTHITPSFVEFDMRSEGFACLYIPSLAPQGPLAQSVVNSEVRVLGGMGTGERTFPPTSGLTFSSWFCVDKFSDDSSHPVRLLTITRQTQVGQQMTDEECLKILLQKIRCQSRLELFIRTTSSQDGAHIELPDFSGQWCHIGIVLHRSSMLKNSNVVVYIDGVQVASRKLHYISPTAPQSCSIHAYIGTSVCDRRAAKLVWRQGPCHIVDDALSSAAIQNIYDLGANYVGSLQAGSGVVVEDKVSLGIHAHAMSLMTLAKIRKVYNRLDAKFIAKLLDTSLNDNTTPIRILHNSAGHLSGSARSLGSVLVGYVGVRTFVPKPVARTLLSVGGAGLLLGFVAQATDVEGLYASVKALANVLRHVPAAKYHMERVNGFQILAMLLSSKHELLNGHILHLALGLVQCSRAAFEHLLCDLDIWRRAPTDLQRPLFDRLRELIAESIEHKSNEKLLNDLVIKVLHRLRYDRLLPKSTSLSMADLLKLLLLLHPTSTRSVGQFIVTTLPAPLTGDPKINEEDLQKEPSTDDNEFMHNIRVRQLLLQILLDLLQSKNRSAMRDNVQRNLGFDWIHLLLAPHLYEGTVISGVRILMSLINQPNIFLKYKEGGQTGGWLDELGSQVPKREGTEDWLQLQQLLPHHSNIPQLYFFISSLMLGDPPKFDMPTKPLELDTIYSYSLGIPVGAALPKNAPVRGEACIVLLVVLRTQLSVENVEEDKASLDIPITIMQLLIFLYHNHPGIAKLFMSCPGTLSALASTLFPLRHDDEEPARRQYPQSPERAATPGFTVLCSHPARKFVTDLLRTLIMDSLSLPHKGPSVFDVLIDSAVPDYASKSQKCEFLTELVRSVSEHLANINVLGDQSPIPIAPGGSYSHLCSNVFHIAARSVDVLWREVYIRQPSEIFDFVSAIVCQCKRISSGMSLDGIYKSLNRCVLYELSRSVESEESRERMTESLHRVLVNKSMLLGPVNCDFESILCFFYCVLELIIHPDVGVMAGPESRSKFFIPKTTDNNADDRTIKELVESARKVWSELYASKHQVIEEQHKFVLSHNPIEAYNAIKDNAIKSWKSYLEKEQKGAFSSYEKHQITSKFQMVQKMGSGVLKNLAPKRQSSKTSVVNGPRLANNFVDSSTQMSIVKDVIHWRAKQYIHSAANVAKSVTEEWKAIESELLLERGVWGPTSPCPLDKWMLDPTEGLFRMRKKLMANDRFYDHYPPPNNSSSSDSSTPTSTTMSRHRPPSSYDSKLYKEKRKKVKLLQDDKRQEEHLSSTVFDNSPLKMLIDGEEDEGEVKDTENESLRRLLEKNEKMQHMFRCARVEGLDAHEGIIIFGREHFYVIDGFTLTRTPQSIVDLDSLPPESFEPIVPKTGTKPIGELSSRTCVKIAYDDIKEIHERRYLLQPNAVEVFCTDGRSTLIVCPKTIRPRLFAKIQAVATRLTDSATESVSGQRSGTKVEPGAISSLIGERSVTQRWLQGEVTNFEYLMCLNTLAGRSYNDLMQYPVFPWLLADYDSSELDLNNPATFRDFTKPMGAQCPSRWQQFEKRYKDWDDTHSDTPPYHYGTHYSSAMIVASYLVRMEPFAQHLVRLQGGHFDLPDRMFHSIKEGWLSASQHNMADVKELIPEFFYLPDFLTNDNKFDLGSKQSGVVLGDVALPAWAKNDPREFVRMHREALESDFVSANIHHWIDLIFGYKQQGDEAVEAMNVFHHLFYEGAVDIDTIDDPMERNAVTSFINNFGQIPSQLFKRPHPQKKFAAPPRPLSEVIPGASYLTTASVTFTAGHLYYHHLDSLLPSNYPVKQVKTGVGQIVALDKGHVLAVEQNKILIPPTFTRYVAWGFSDRSIRLANYDSERPIAIWEDVETGGGEVLCAAAPNNKTLVTGGTSCVVCVWHMTTGKDAQLALKKALYGHTEPITCITASSSHNIIASGSRDRSVMLWDLNRLIFVRQLRNHAAPVASVCINEATGDIATCAGTYLYLWSVNGQILASVNTATGRGQQILCVAISTAREWDTNNVIMTGNNDGVVRMWALEYAQFPDDSQSSSTTNATSSVPKYESGGLPMSVDSELLDAAIPIKSPTNSLTAHSSEEDDGEEVEELAEEATEATDSGNISPATAGDFVIVGSKRPKGELKTGFKWQRQLIFKSKLTMHTAYERKDNQQPAAVTAIAVSRDHRTIYVGDLRGRVHSWTVPNEIGKGPSDHWIKDDQAEACTQCNVKFTLYERRHHCRSCGAIFCENCSKRRIEIPKLKIYKRVRVCTKCHDMIVKENEQETDTLMYNS